MNYKEDVFADVYTLAHEAGHSMHTWSRAKIAALSGLRLPDLPGGSRLHLQRGAAHASSARANDDPKMRAYIINRQIDDIRGTLFRQTMFAEFEKIIHAIEESGDALDARRFQERISRAARGLLWRKTSCSIRSSIWNACASRISTARSTFTNMRPEFLRPSLSRKKF